MAERITIRARPRQTTTGNRAQIDIKGQSNINLDVDVSGGAVTRRITEADQLTTPREIALLGGVTGSSTFDGSEDISINTFIQPITNDEIERMMSDG